MCVVQLCRSWGNGVKISALIFNGWAMAHYAIGDLQGCYDQLLALLDKIGFNHGSDTLWLTGDLVNRGPKSLECLQFAMRHESSVRTVLGNHDLHLLAIGYGSGKLKKKDTLAPILQHQDFIKMRDWLRAQPLLLQNDSHVMTHAGVLPQWSFDDAAARAAELEAVLQSDDAETFFAQMYGNLPDTWHDSLQGMERMRMICNVFTRMRVLTVDKRLDLDFKSDYSNIPANRCAWFDAPRPLHQGRTIVFGHWSALGLRDEQGVLALDTGALWGGRLTAADLSNHQIYSVAGLPDGDWRTHSN